MPYREPDDSPLRRWTLVGARRWQFVGAAAVLLTIGGPLVLVLATSAPLSMLLEGIALTALPGLALLALWAWAGDGYRVHGGRGELRLFRDRIEIPRARRAGSDVLPLSDVRTERTVMRSRVNGVEVNETHVLVIAAGDVRRSLAHPLVGDVAALRRIEEDIARAKRGEPLTEDPRVSIPERDALDARLDDELAK